MNADDVRSELDLLGPPMQHVDQPFNDAGFGFLPRPIIPNQPDEGVEPVPAVCVEQLAQHLEPLADSDATLVLMGISAWFATVLELCVPGLMPVDDVEYAQARALVEDEYPAAGTLMAAVFA